MLNKGNPYSALLARPRYHRSVKTKCVKCCERAPQLLGRIPGSLSDPHSNIMLFGGVRVCSSLWKQKVTGSNPVVNKLKRDVPTSQLT